MKVIPWRVSLRGITRNARTCLLLAFITAMVVAAPFVAGTLTATGTFTAEDVAEVSMGRADVQVRTASFRQASEVTAPQAGQAGVTSVVEDRDIELVLEGPSETVSITARLLDIRDPLTSGIVVRSASEGSDAVLALSEAAREDLGVLLGDEVHVSALGTWLTVTDEIAFAPDTRTPLAVVNPEALTPSDRESLVELAESPRWLVSTDDLSATLAYIEELGLQAVTRQAVPAPDDSSLLDPTASLTIVSIAGITLLAAGGTALAGFHRRQTNTLARLGLTPRESRRVIGVETRMVTLVGIIAAVPLGLGVSLLGREIGESLSGQVWNELRPAWLYFATAAVAAFIVAPLLMSFSAKSPRPWTSPKGGLNRVRRVDAWLLGSRAARHSGRGSVLGAIAIALVVAIGAGSVLVVDIVEQRYASSYEPQVPEAMVGLGLPRQLTADEERSLAAGSNSAVTEDRRAMYDSPELDHLVPVVVDSPVTQCFADPSKDIVECSRTVGIFEATLAVVDPNEASGFLGRELTQEEAEAIQGGDGLLLADGPESPRLVLTGMLAENRPDLALDAVDIALNPVSVAGYAGYERSPGLLISHSALERWELVLDDDSLSYYLLTPLEHRPEEQSVRRALPADVAASADVVYDEKDEVTAVYAAASRTITAVSAALVFLIVVLLVLTWGADSSNTMRTLARLGMRRRDLTMLIVARGLRPVVSALVAGVVLTIVLVWVFAAYVGVSIPIAGTSWLIPVLTAASALPVAAMLRTTFGPESQTRTRVGSFD